MSDDQTIIAAMEDARTKALEGLAGYKFWMFGYHAARWVNYNNLLPRPRRFRSPFKGFVELARQQLDRQQEQLPLLEIDSSAPLLGADGDGS